VCLRADAGVLEGGKGFCDHAGLHAIQRSSSVLEK
jgi:hypothetical protein